jgi:hypothetical protein
MKLKRQVMAKGNGEKQNRCRGKKNYKNAGRKFSRRL